MSKVLTGARAIVEVDNQIVGIFESCNYGANIGAEPHFILGRFSAAEITANSYEAVSANCSGFRVVGNGVHTLPKMPKVQDLLNLGAITLTVRDRQTNETIARITGCVPISYSSGVNARASSRVQITYLGLILNDESGAQDESSGATNLP